MKRYTDLHYMPITPRDEQWGIVCTTAGHQIVPPGSCYPPSGKHPSGYVFTKYSGRVLHEYQMVYIVEGEGWFESKHCHRREVKAGTMLLLFPDEWLKSPSNVSNRMSGSTGLLRCAFRPACMLR